MAGTMALLLLLGCLSLLFLLSYFTSSAHPLNRSSSCWDLPELVCHVLQKLMLFQVVMAILVVGGANKSPSLQVMPREVRGKILKLVVKDLRYAEWRLDELHEIVQDQEKIVRHLEVNILDHPDSHELTKNACSNT
eukprot:381398-Hanusia_phi.AAC.2